MPRKKKEAVKITSEDIKQLWRKIPAQVWYGLFQKLNKDGKWQLNGHAVKGCCPYHDDKNPSLVLNFDKKFGKCFGCGKVITDLIQFVAKLQNTSYSSAYSLLELEIGISGIIGLAANKLNEYNATQEMKKAAAVAMNRVIDEYVRDRPDYLEYLKPGIIYLTKGRGLSLDVLPNLPVGLYAKPEHLKKYIPSEFHPRFEKYFEKIKGPAIWGAPCFHYNNEPGNISRFKIRLLNNGAQVQCKNYGITGEIQYEFARGLVSKDFIWVEDPYTQETGIFGLFHYIRMIGVNETNAYVTEGEFDVLSVMAAQLANGRDDFMLLGLSGNGNSGLSFLRELGLRTIWVVGDSVAKNGDNVVGLLLQNEKNFIGDAVNKALSYKVFLWPPDMLGGDIDEAVRQMGYQTVCKRLFSERNANFLSSYMWVVKKCDAEIQGLKLEAESAIAEAGGEQKAEISHTLKNNIKTAIAKWFRCLHDQFDKLSFLQRYEKSEGLVLQNSPDVNCSMYNLDTVDGATARIAEEVRKKIDIVYYESTQGGNSYTVWSKSRCEKSIMSLHETKIEEVFSQYLEENLISWAKKILTGSVLLAPKDKEREEEASRRVRGVILDIMRQVVLTSLSEAKQLDKLRVVGQGIHFSDLKKNGVAENVYFVNGNMVFKGTYSQNSGTPIEWEFVNSIVDNDFIFKLHPKLKWSEVSDVSDLYSGISVDLRKLYDDIHLMLQGWRFEQHDWTVKYLAAWIMSLPIQEAIGQVSIAFITGESTSGKTSFARGLLGGYGSEGYDVPYILEAARFTSDATAAWMYQEMDHSSLLLSIDEAEARQDSQHSRRIAELQKLLYSIPTGGARITRGGSTYEQRIEYFLEMPVIMSAIEMASDPVFMSRMLKICTKKDVKRQNLADYVSDHFSFEDIKRMRHDITTGLLARLPDLIRRMEKLRRNLGENTRDANATSRTVNVLAPALAVYDLLGFDAEAFFEEWAEANKDFIDSLNQQEYQSELLHALLYTEGVKATIDENLTGLVTAYSLIKRGEYNVLNNSDCGVAFLPDRGWIVVIWRSVKYTLLRTTPELKKMSDSALRESVSKNRYLVKISPEDHSYIIKMLDKSDLKNPSQYSVFKADYVLSDKAIQELEKAVEAEQSANSTPSEDVYDYSF